LKPIAYPFVEAILLAVFGRAEGLKRGFSTMKLNRFLALGSLLAAGSVLFLACSTEHVDTPTGSGGSAGAGGSGGKGGSVGSTGGSAGQSAAGAAGAAGAEGSTGGAAGAAGASGGSAGAAGAASACLDDAGQAGVDGGWGSLCDTLPYAGLDCSGSQSPGELLCRYMVDDVSGQRRGRLGVIGPLFECLSQIESPNACDPAGANACVQSVFAQACDVESFGWTGGTATCVDVGDACPSTDVDERTCLDTLSAFQPWAQAVILDCYFSLPSCDTDLDDFSACVFPL
jgi:hypothetical protein